MLDIDAEPSVLASAASEAKRLNTKQRTGTTIAVELYGPSYLLKDAGHEYKVVSVHN